MNDEYGVSRLFSVIFIGSLIMMVLGIILPIVLVGYLVYENMLSGRLFGVAMVAVAVGPVGMIVGVVNCLVDERLSARHNRQRRGGILVVVPAENGDDDDFPRAA